MANKTLTAKRLFSAAFQTRAYSAPADRSIPAAKQNYVPTSGTYPKGFLVGTAFAGVKASNTKYDDVTMIVSEKPCPAAAVFTRNIFQAAPVKISRIILRERANMNIRGVIINSGCANAVTGQLGLKHASVMARKTAECFTDLKPGGSHDPTVPGTLIMSTGVIGQRLPIDRITDAIPKAHAALGSTHDHWLKAAQAICTTDTFPKLISRSFTLPSHPDTTYSIAGMTKGAGMIHPNMATLLAVICTDVSIDPRCMTSSLRYVANKSFNSISIDGDTSTNDTVAFFANGAAAPEGMAPLVTVPRPKFDDEITERELSPDAVEFMEILATFMTDLAKLVVRDGEGATKFVTIRVHSDVSLVTARRAATSIARSSLVKTALYGKDANWGRILCAIGYAPGIIASMEVPELAYPTRQERDGPKKMIKGLQVSPERTSVSFKPSDGSEVLKLLVRGEPEDVDEARAKTVLEMEDLVIDVRLEDDGNVASRPEEDGHVTITPRSSDQIYTATVWTCD